MIAALVTLWTMAATATHAATDHARSASLPEPARSLTLYVSPAGNDSWSGRRATPNGRGADGPLASITAARDRLRAERAAGHVAGQARVVIRGGTYPLTDTLTFGPEDSDTSYEAYRSELPVLSGGVRITGWQPTGNGVWKATIPEVLAGEVNQLFVNGRRAKRTRLPHSGFFTIEDAAPSTPASAGKGYDRFQYHAGDLNPAWPNLQDVEVLAIHTWNASRLRIASIDDTDHTVTFTGPTSTTEGYGALTKGGRYYVENVPDALDEPGSWYWHRSEHAVYYHALPGEDVPRLEIVAPRLVRLVALSGDSGGRRYVTGLQFRGIAFEHAAWQLSPQGYSFPQAEVPQLGAIEAYAARSCRLEGCTVAHVGGYGVALGRACKQVTLDACRLFDLGAGGVKIGETNVRTDDEEVTSGNTVENCQIHDGGTVHPAGIGIWIGQSYGNALLHNTIHDLYYTGISIGWTWGYGASKANHNEVAYNHVYNIGRGLLSDMGAIYTLGISPGTRIHHNLFHDILSYSYGGWGIYFDEGSTGIVAEENVVYHTKTGGFHQHYGESNILHNNVFALATEAQLQRTRPEEHLSFTFEHNIVYWDQGDLLNSNWGDTNHFRMDYNLYWDASGRPISFAGKTFAQWQAAGEDTHSRIADPLFVDAGKLDFRLRSDSPAFQLGWRAIDLSGVGLQRAPRQSAGHVSRLMRSHSPTQRHTETEARNHVRCRDRCA